MTSFLRKTLTGGVTALSLGALVVATSSPASAQWRGHRVGGWRGPGIAAGVIGGLALGALATRPYAYGAPVYEEYYPPADYVVPACHREWRPVYTSSGYYVRDRLVRVCN